MAGLVASCHDLSDGGLAVAAAEAAFAGGFGMDLDLARVLWKGDAGEKTDAALLFSESASRHLVTVHPEDRDEFEAIMTGNCFASIGTVTDGARTLTDHRDFPAGRCVQAAARGAERGLAVPAEGL